MSNDIRTLYPGRVNPADADYPFGSIKNESVPGANDGTPLTAEWGNDFEALKQGSLKEAGATPSGTTDTAENSQVLNALKNNTATVADIATGRYPVGRRLIVTDRGNAVFVIQSGGTPNGMDIVSAGTGKTAVLQTAGLRSINIEVLGALDGEANATATTAAINRAWALGLIPLVYGDKYFNSSLVFQAGYTLLGGNSNSDFLTWVGPDVDWALKSADQTNGVFNCIIGNISIRGKSGQNVAKLLDAVGLRRTYFHDVRFRNYLKGMRTSNTWYNTYYRCEFVANGAIDGTVDSTGIDFVNAGIGTPITNATSFLSCIISNNYRGIRGESIGDGVVFDDACTLEANGIGVEFTGSGLCHSFTFRNGYIELNKKNIVHNKAGAGELKGVTITDNMIGFAEDGAGVLEIAVNTSLGNHKYTFERNRFRGDVVPSSGYCITLGGGVSQQNLRIDWFDNKGQTGGTAVKPWDGDVLDWGYINSDIHYQVTLLTPDANGDNWASVTKLKIGVRDGIARLFGDAQSATRVVSSAITIATALPVSLRPLALWQAQISTRTDVDSQPGSAGVNITTNGTIRLVGVTAQVAMVDITWPLRNVESRAVSSAGV